MVLRVSPSAAPPGGDADGGEVVTLDKRRRQVTIVEDAAKTQQEQSRLGVAAPKMFAFDQVYAHSDPQVGREIRTYDYYYCD